MYDAHGNVYVTGYFTGVVDFDPGDAVYNLTADGSFENAFIAKYTKDGALLWAFDLGGRNFNNLGYDIKVDAHDMIYVTGGVSGNNVDFDPSSGVYNLSQGTYQTGFIAKYNGAKKPDDPSFFNGLLVLAAL